MSRLGRFLLPIILWMGACWNELAGQAPHQVVTFDSLMAQLDSIADTASIEHYRCLLGWRRGDTLKVFAAWAPPIAHADYNTVAPAVPCPDGSVAVWHNHLPWQYPMILGGAKEEGAARANDAVRIRLEPWSVCDLSPPDRRSALTDSPFVQIISVAHGVHCAWLRLDDTTLTRIPQARP